MLLRQSNKENIEFSVIDFNRKCQMSMFNQLLEFRPANFQSLSTQTLNILEDIWSNYYFKSTVQTRRRMYDCHHNYIGLSSSTFPIMTSTTQ